MVRLLRIVAGARKRPWVRPWALSAPIVVLLIALPLIRLRRPADISHNERARLASVQAIVEHKTLAIDNTRAEFQRTADRVIVTDRATGARHTYSKQPPVMSFLLAGDYWLMRRCGLTFAKHADIVAYLLIVLGVTVPVAAAAGMVYRLGRLFELSRPMRAGLALASVCGSGLISYATVLNSHAPAASLVLMACACLFHVATTCRPWLRAPWLIIAGLCASLAAVIDLAAPAFAGLFLLVILAMQGSVLAKLRWAGCYALGVLPPLALHAMLTVPITGDMLPGFLHRELAPQGPVVVAKPAPAIPPLDDDEVRGPSALGEKIGHLFDALLGSRGLISHFPVIIVGLLGIGMVLRRHWPLTTKAMAVVALLGGAAIMGAYIILNPDWSQPMFAVRWFVIFLPVVLFWAGAWLRKRHHPAVWATAGVLLCFSIATSLVGATNPFVSPGHFTAYTAAKKLFQAPPATPPMHAAVAGG